MLNTRSSFIYGHIIDDTNFTLNFDEGAGEKTAELKLGSYSITDFITELERALNAAGTQLYTVTLDRTSRKITIAAGANFDLLFFTGSSVGTGVATLTGFDSLDLTGLNSYEGQNASGFEYQPQFLLQDYVAFEDIQNAASSSVSQSAEGIVQVASFGTLYFMECNIQYINDYTQQEGAVIEGNPNAVQEFRDFMETVTQKSELEFLPDRDDRSDTGFTKCILESTRKSKEGTGFQVYELIKRKLMGYYESKKLIFRKVK